MGKEEIMVSVCCTAFKHEKYIRQCLEGFVMQKTDFKYEVIINDDASPDGTADIIREYQAKYPDIIKPIYQPVNQFSQGINIMMETIYPKAKGKYFALCEGDDFWTDPLKLQKQYNAMERNPDCHMCVCKVKRISEDGGNVVGYCPSFPLEEGMLSSDTFLNHVFREYSFHTSSFFFKAEDVLKCAHAMPKFRQVCPVGDEAYMLYFGQLGNVYYLADEMSCNRRGSIDGWNQRTWSSKENRIKYYLGMAETYKEYDIYTENKYHDLCAQRIFTEYYFIAESKDDFEKLKNSELFSKQSKRRKLRILMGTYCTSMLKLYYKMTGQG